MPLISEIRGIPVAGPKGRSLGSVSEVLFHPSEPRVVGLLVEPDPLLLVFRRTPRFLPLGRVSGWGKGVVVSSTRVPRARVGEREIGAEWDVTVIWRRMPARTEGGSEAGRVADAGFRKLSGDVTRLMLTSGMLGDAALGVREVPAEQVAGFDAAAPGGGAVLIADAALEIPASGGAVRAAGDAAGAVRDAGTGLAREAGIKAAAAGMAAVKMASESKTGRAAGRMARGAWKGVRSAVAEALRPDDEE